MKAACQHGKSRHECRCSSGALLALLVVAALGCTPPVAATKTDRAVNSPSPEAATAEKESAAAVERPSTDKSDWPIFRGNALANGVSASALADDPALLWKKSFKDGMFESTPVIEGGVIYVGGLNGYFYALDLATGDEKWKFHSELGFRAAGAVRDGLVYVGDTEGRFACLDATNGDLKWTLSTDAEINAGANFYKDNVLIGSQNGALYSLNARTGAEVWKYSIDNMIQCSPTIVEDRVFLAGCDSILHIINVESGVRVSQVDIQDPTGVTPAAVGDLIFFATQGARVFCVNWKEAKVSWVYEHPKKKSPYQSSPAVANGIVAIGGRDRMIHGLKADTGEEIWTFPTRRNVDASPVIVKDRVYVGAGDGRIYGLNLASGEKVWEYEAGGDFVGSPAVAAGRMVVAGGAGDVLCFGTPPTAK